MQPTQNEIVPTFAFELRQLVNKYSLENGSNTPDFILANYLSTCLSNFEAAVEARETWYGRGSKPTSEQLTQPEAVVTPVEATNEDRVSGPSGGEAALSREASTAFAVPKWIEITGDTRLLYSDQQNCVPSSDFQGDSGWIDVDYWADHENYNTSNKCIMNSNPNWRFRRLNPEYKGD